MSKAFVKESEEDSEDLSSEEVEEKTRPRGSNHITPEGFLALKNELSRLWKVDRPKVTEEVSVAAAQGDRSENAEYIYGKKKLREIDRRIRFLTKRLDALTVVGAPPNDRNRVYFGAWITIEDEDGARSTYRLVGPDEIDLSARKISIDSPVGKALLGRAKGEQTIVTRPKGAMEVSIVDVRYES